MADTEEENKSKEESEPAEELDSIMEDVDAIGSLNGFYALNFPTSGGKVLPFVGGHIGFGFEPGDDPFVFGIFGGIKYFITDGGAIHIQPFYRRYNYSDFSDLNHYGIEFGISLFK